MMKVIMIALLALGLTNCSQSNYKVNKEVNKEGRTLDKVPQWYIDAKVDKGFIFEKDANLYIYSVGQGNSPDLQLAIEKAMMIAKAELADKLQGQMNKRTDLYITEVGQDGNKQVVSKVEETIVNLVRDTMIQGYESWEKAVYETPDGEYRVYIGLKMGVGDSNKLAEYIAKNAFSAVDIDTLAKNAIDKVMVEDITNPDGIKTIEN
jgi:translation initiation factor 2 beta subunit (eIF-2beta)/eIF-5